MKEGLRDLLESSRECVILTELLNYTAQDKSIKNLQSEPRKNLRLQRSEDEKQCLSLEVTDQKCSINTKGPSIRAFFLAKTLYTI